MSKIMYECAKPGDGPHPYEVELGSSEQTTIEAAIAQGLGGYCRSCADHTVRPARQQPETNTAFIT